MVNIEKISIASDPVFIVNGYLPHLSHSTVASTAFAFKSTHFWRMCSCRMQLPFAYHTGPTIAANAAENMVDDKHLHINGYSR